MRGRCISSTQVLASLRHPSIPSYIDYFEQASEGDQSFYIVQEVVAGKTLAQMVAEGMRATDEEARATLLLRIPYNGRHSLPPLPPHLRSRGLRMSCCRCWSTSGA